MQLRVRDPAVAMIALALASCAPSTTTGSRATATPCDVPPPQATSEQGSIAGVVSYPADVIIPMTVYAIPVPAIHASSIRGQATCFRTVQTVFNQSTFHILDVAAGTYYVLASTFRAIAQPVASAARTTPPHNNFEGAYTNAVACGLQYGCNDHGLVPVTVQPGKATTGVQVTDWYAGPGAFPDLPAASPALLPPEPAAFSSGIEAGKYYAQSVTGGVYTESTCPVNRACVSLGPQHDGSASAYFEASAGSNQDIVPCAVYLYSDPTGWHNVEVGCRPTSSVFPAVNATGIVSGVMGDNSCINVRSLPGRIAKVVGCLAQLTPVTIDGGPAYVNDPGSTLSPSDRLWWHLKGKGWMVHFYLRYG